MAQPIDLMDTAISITVNLSGIPANAAGFGTVMYVSPAFVIGGGLKTKTYTYATHSTDLAADVTAGVLSQKLADDITSAFAQNPHPMYIKIGDATAYAPGGPSTLSTDLAAIQAEDDDWYGLVVNVDGQLVADKELQLIAASTWVSSQKKVLVCESEHADVYNPAKSDDVCSELKALAHERTAFIWSQLTGGPPGTVEQPADLCAACRWLAFDPDLISAPFRAQVSSVLRCKLTATGVDLASADISAVKAKYGNVLQLYGSAAAFLDPGTNVKNRAMEEVLSGDWIEARVRADIATQAVALANRGEKWPLNAEGASYLAAIVNRWLQQGVNANHFSDYTPGVYTINTTTKTITYAARATYLDNALAFSVTINFD